MDVHVQYLFIDIIIQVTENVEIYTCINNRILNVDIILYIFSYTQHYVRYTIVASSL